MSCASPMLARHLHDKVADGYGPQKALQSIWLSSSQPSFVWLVTGREAHKDPLAAASRRLLYPPALSLLYCHTTCVPAYPYKQLSARTRHWTLVLHTQQGAPAYHTAPAPACTCPYHTTLASG